jgi:antitoxin VapB
VNAEQGQPKEDLVHPFVLLFYTRLMALNIKDDETDRLARELARATGESITEATRLAIQERLARIKQRNRSSGSGELQAIIDRGRARRTLDDRPAEELIGYDADGLPH